MHNSMLQEKKTLYHTEKQGFQSSFTAASEMEATVWCALIRITSFSQKR